MPHRRRAQRVAGPESGHRLAERPSARASPPWTGGGGRGALVHRQGRHDRHVLQRHDPLAAATTGVEGLEAIIPIAPNTSYYHYYRSNGLVRHPGGWMGEDIDFLYDFINSGNPERRDWCNANIRDGEMAAEQDRVTGDYNEFWAGRDYLNDLDGVKAATLMAHAFNDWNVMPEHSFRVSRGPEGERRAGARSTIHQGGHGGPPPLELMNRWFTRYLYGVENGVENDPQGLDRPRGRRSGPTRRPTPTTPTPTPRHVTLHPWPAGSRPAP